MSGEKGGAKVEYEMSIYEILDGLDERDEVICACNY